MVLGDAMEWADKQDCNILLVETAGLCLRCAPYVDGGLGICVLEATSGMNLPLKVGPILSLADVCVVTKGDLVSQAEREVFRARIQDVSRSCRSAKPTPSTASASTPCRQHPGHARCRRPHDAARQPAGGHLHDLRRQARRRLAVALRRGARPRQPELLPGAVSMATTSIWITPRPRPSTRGCTTPWSPIWPLVRQPVEPALGRPSGSRRRRSRAPRGGRAHRRPTGGDRLHRERHRVGQPRRARRARAPCRRPPT